MHRGRIFGIGLNKTGTTSLAAAVSILGQRSFHYAAPGLDAGELDEAIRSAVGAGTEPLGGLPRLHDVDAIFDVPALEQHFDAFDRAYPESKFILHTRDLDGWLDSRERHVLANRANPAYRGDWLVVDRDGWSDEWAEHHERVATYFADRPGDLLTFRIRDGDGWPELAGFLGCAVPSQPFQHANSGAQRALVVSDRGQDLLRRLRSTTQHRGDGSG